MSSPNGVPLVEMNAPTINNLLTALNECTEWGQVLILDSTSNYNPKDEREAQSICERLTPSTCKHLWNILMGDSLLANEDVVHEELKRNCNKILLLLTFYPRRHPKTTEDGNVSGNVTSSETEKIATSLGGSGDGNKSDKPSSVSNKEAEKKLRARLTKKLDVEESIAWEIFCSFMMFEYKAKASNYSKIMETELYVVSFLKDIWSFYMRERLCWIYCSQIILAEAMNTKNKYQEIFTAFAQSSSLDNWVKWLCKSFEEVQDEEEVIALLHTLSILLFHFNDQDNVIPSFVEYYKPLARHYKSQDILQAEAVLYYCVVLCGDPKIEYHNTCIEAFVELQLNTRMLLNPYTLGALISCLMLRSPDNDVVKARIKEVEYADRYVRSLIDLVVEYNKNSFKNKHGLSAIITRCVYNSVDIILRLFVKENFGTALDWYLLLSHLLRDTDIAEEFLSGNSTDILNLYLEALIQFPVEISPILAIWGSIFEAVSKASTCTALSMGSKESDGTLKCLAAFKHLLVIIFSKPEVSSQMPRETKAVLMKEVYDKFWKLNDETETSEKRLVLLSELMFQVCPTEYQQFLEDLASKTASSFHSNLVTVQISLLYVVNSCVKHIKDEINICTVDNRIKVISGIFFKSNHVFQSTESERVFPLLSVAASTVSTLISSDRCVNVDRVYQRHHLASSIAHTAYMGITKEVGVQVVAECLNALMRMTMRSETCHMIQYCGLVKALWLPMSKFGDDEAKQSDIANAWQKIYSLCIYLNTCLLSTQNLEDCLNFLSINGLCLTSKLWGLSELMNRSPLTNLEKNFKDLKDRLTFDVFVLNFISTMSPYLETWKKIQKCDVNQIIEGVFVTLRTTVGLLSQPNHLILLISKTKPQPNFDFKLTPQLLEVQTKLWDVMALGVHIFYRLRLKSLDYVDMEQLHATMYSVGQLCVKALTKGDRRSHPSINVTQRIITTLEKFMSILYFINQYLRKHSEDMSSESNEMDTNEIKPQPPALRREMTAEVPMLCDSVRRLSIPKSEFLSLLCASVETPFKINGALLVH